MQFTSDDVQKAAGFSRAEMILIHELKRLTDALSEAERRRERAELERDEIANDRDLFARKYHEQKLLTDYWRNEAAKAAGDRLPKGRTA